MNSGLWLVRAMQILLAGIVLIFPAFLIYVFVFIFYSGDSLEPAVAQTVPTESLCELEKFDRKLKTAYQVRVPSNYDEHRLWPLLVVFAPAMDSAFMERYTGLTNSVTAVGYAIAYVDSIPMSFESMGKLHVLIEDIEKNWCIDSERIVLSGHSNGGTISQALNFLPVKEGELEKSYFGFISSAAGLRKEDLSEYECRPGANAFVLHNEGDTHFKDFGRGASEWWAACNECELEAVDQGDGCWLYPSCADGAIVQYCEQEGGHSSWPKRHEEIAKFLTSI